MGELSAADHRAHHGQKYFGWFMFSQPVLALNDVSLIKHIEVKDFDHFTDRISNDMMKKVFAGGELDQVSLVCQNHFKFFTLFWNLSSG